MLRQLGMSLGGNFDHHRLDAFRVARDVLRMGDTIARRMPRGYSTLQDQLRRALLSAYLGIAEASGRTGADRMSRFRAARGEASEAAAAMEAVSILRLAPEAEVHAVMALLDRLCAMLTRLAGLHRQHREPPPASLHPHTETDSNTPSPTPTRAGPATRQSP